MANGPRTVRLDPPAGARVSAADLLRSHGCRDGQVLVGMAPGAAYGRAKRWLPGRFAELIARLGREAVTSVLVGSKEDVGTGTEIERSLRKMRDGTRDGALSVNLIGRTDLGALAGVITMCRTFVSNDSGAMHVAAAVGVPVTAIFGASDERATSPLPFAGSGTVMAAAGPTPSSRHSILTNPVWCRPCMLRECPIDHRCMAGIPAERVFDVVMGQIRHGDA
jgi:heptosyltransferase-2